MEETAFEPFEGHASLITCLAYSPHDGAFLATGSADKTIRIWDAETGSQVGEPLEGHTDWVLAVAYSPDGQRLVSGSRDRSLRIWDTNTHRVIMGPLEGYTDWIWAVQYSPDGALIASGGWDKRLKLWTAYVGDCIATFEHPHDINSVSFSPSGEHVATACSDSHVRIFAVDRLELLHELSGHRDWVRSVQYSPNGSVIASASRDHTIRLWDAHSGQLVQGPLRGHNSEVADIAFSPDGQHLVSCSWDESIRIWSATSGKCLAGPLYEHQEWVRAICCSPDRKHFASCSYGDVRVWSVDDGKQVLPRPIDKDNDDFAEQYKMRTYRPVRAIAWFSDGQHFARAGDDYTISTWDARTGQEAANRRIWRDDRVYDIDISRNDGLLASGEDDGIVSIWDLAHGNSISKRLSGHDGRVWAVRFTPDGERLASGGDDSTIRVWSVPSGASLHVVNAHSGVVRTLSISKDGSRLASGSEDETVRVWDLDSYEAIGQPMGHGGIVLSVCFAPDGSQILSGSWDKTIRVWDISRGEQVFSFNHNDNVNCVRFSMDGSKFLSASDDKRVCVWEASTRKLIQTLQPGNNSYFNKVASAAFSPNGTRIVSGTNGGDLRLWDVKSGRLLLPKRLGGGGAGTDDHPSNPENHGAKIGKSQVDSDMDSFLERSAVPRGRRDFFVDSDHENMSQPRADNAGARKVTFSPLRKFRRVMNRRRGGRRTSVNGQDSEEARESHEMQTLPAPRRVSGIVYTGRAAPRYAAAPGDPITWRELFSIMFSCFSAPADGDSPADAQAEAAARDPHGQNQQTAGAQAQAGLSSAGAPAADVTSTFNVS